MNFASVKCITIPQGDVSTISVGGQTVWKKSKYKRELDYIESTGTQWIETGIIPTANSVIISKMAFTTNPSGTSAEQINGVSYNGRCAWGYARSITNSKFYVGIKEKNINTNVTLDDLPHTFTINMNGNWSIDSKSGYVDSGSAMPTKTIWLFGRHTTSETPSPYLNGKIYFTQIFESENLVLDLVPVLDWDNTPCMYDKVTGELRYNQGTGEFLYGMG